MLALESHNPAPVALAVYAARLTRCVDTPAVVARWLDDHDALRMADVPAAWRATLERFAFLRGDTVDAAELPLRRAVALEKGLRERKSAKPVRVVESTATVVDPREGEKLAARIEAMESPDEFAPIVAAIEGSSLARGFKRALARAAREQRDRLAAGWSAE